MVKEGGFASGLGLKMAYIWDFGGLVAVFEVVGL